MIKGEKSNDQISQLVFPGRFEKEFYRKPHWPVLILLNVLNERAEIAEAKSPPGESLRD